MELGEETWLHLVHDHIDCCLGLAFQMRAVVTLCPGSAKKLRVPSH